MTRKPLIAGNWKLNKNIAETKELASALAQFNKDNNPTVDVMIVPTFTSLAAAQDCIKDSQIILGAQDFSQHDSGAYTGEVSTEMLKEIGVKAVLIGHSERREIFKEDDEIINAKLNQALKSNLLAVLCCGESLETREAGNTDTWICNQIEAALKNNEINSDSQLVVAYEPIWAIGTGKTCESNEANRVIKVIRKKLAELLNEDLASKIRILYGGSVKSTTIDAQMAESDIDGALVGGASLKADEFGKIITGAAAKAVA